MKQEMDKIQFENRREIEEIMIMIDKFLKQNPKEKENETIKEFFDKLDVMHMSW